METHEVTIPVRNLSLYGFFQRPDTPRGVVIFAHGSGSSRFSSRNQFVANFLQNHSYATLLFDLLTEDEEDIDAMTRHLRFDIPLLTERLVEVTKWLELSPKVISLPMAFFGASTGAAAALQAAAALPFTIRCVISRGGRPDLAEKALPHVSCPTLLIVGEQDETVLALNRKAQLSMTHAHTELKIVRTATHLFEEPGTLQHVAKLSVDWLEKYCIHPSRSIGHPDQEAKIGKAQTQI